MVVVVDVLLGIGFFNNGDKRLWQHLLARKMHVSSYSFMLREVESLWIQLDGFRVILYSYSLTASTDCELKWKLELAMGEGRRHMGSSQLRF